MCQNILHHQNIPGISQSENHSNKPKRSKLSSKNGPDGIELLTRDYDYALRQQAK